MLLTNDFYLKEVYNNWVVGKLSDISGLVVFSYFMTSLGSRYKKHVFIFTSIAFSFWETEYSQPLIEFWNSFAPLQVDRFVDYSDIVCIVVLIPLYWYEPKSILTKKATNRLVTYPIVMVTLFSIVATSRANTFTNDTVYVYKYVKVNSSLDFFKNQLEKDNIKYEESDSILVVESDTLSRIILNNIILDQDTIYQATIGIVDKGDKLKVFVESLQLAKELQINRVDYIEYRKFQKKYRIQSVDFFKGIKE